MENKPRYTEIKIKNPMEDSAFIYKVGDVAVAQRIGIGANERIEILDKALYEKYKKYILK